MLLFSFGSIFLIIFIPYVLKLTRCLIFLNHNLILINHVTKVRNA